MSPLRLLTYRFGGTVALNSAQQKHQFLRSTVALANTLNERTKCYTKFGNDSRQLQAAAVPPLNRMTLLYQRTGSCNFSTKCTPDHAGKSDTKASAAIAETDIFGDASKLGLFAKFKLMYKKYWYVLIPVHVVTSIGWFGGFYYMSKSGVDMGALLQHLHFSESVIEKFHNSDMGHIAIAYLCYKVATPVRYAVTLGGTTISIKYLVQMGQIKPIPSKEEFLQLYEQKKAHRAAVKADKEEQKEILKKAQELQKK